MIIYRGKRPIMTLPNGITVLKQIDKEHHKDIYININLSNISFVSKLFLSKWSPVMLNSTVNKGDSQKPKYIYPIPELGIICVNHSVCNAITY